jgi:hypothetical protein
MDNEMIERCAKVLYINDCIVDKEPYNWEVLSAYSKIVYCNEAIVVIKAMREPTERMLSIDAPDMPAGGDVKEIWQATIDAVIND